MTQSPKAIASEWLVKGGIIVVVGYFLVAFILYPIASTLFVGYTPALNILQQPNHAGWQAIRNSLILSAATVLVSGGVGTAMACLLFFSRMYAQRFLILVWLLPMGAPSLVGAVAIQFLMLRNGLMDNLLGGTHHMNFKGFWAILIVHLYSFYPVFLLFILSSLRGWNSQLEEAAQLLGGSRWKIFYRLVVPHVLPSFSSASLVVFLSSMASFTAPYIFGDGSLYLSVLVFYEKSNHAKAAGFATLLILICLIIPLVFRLFQKGSMKLKQKGAIAELKNRGKINIAWSVISWTMALVVALPFLSLVYISLVPDAALMHPGFSHVFIFQNYTGLSGDRDLLRAVGNTFLIAAVTVSMMLIVGTLAAYLSSRYKVLGKAVEAVALLPNGIPGTVLGLSFIVAFNSPGFFTPGLTLTGTFIILPIIYVVRNLPVFTQSIGQPLKDAFINYREPAYLLGATKFGTVKKVILPLLRPSLLYGVLLVSIHSFEEFVTTSFLFEPHTKTISIKIFESLDGSPGAGAALGVLYTLAVITALGLFNRKGALLEAPRG